MSVVSAHGAHDDHAAPAGATEPLRLGPAFRTAGAAAGVGALLLAVGLIVARKQALYSLLAAWAYGLSIAVGTLIFLCIGYVARSTWPVALRRLTEGVVATLPFFAVLAIPLLLGAGDIYLWVHPPHLPGHEGAHLTELLHHKSRYLNVPFFIGRTVVFFALWIGLAELLRSWSLRQDRAGDDELGARARLVGGAALPALGITLTFASVDFLMSLEPTWYSTAYGVYYFAEGFLGAFCVLAIVAHRATLGPLAGRLRNPHFHAVGRLMHAFTAFWAYIAFFQALVIYLADKPEEVPFYVARIAGTWGALLVVLIVGHFVGPFFLLLSRNLKYRSGALAGVAVWQLVMGYLDVYWLVMPVLHPGGMRPHWTDAAALLLVGGGAVAVGLWRASGHAPQPHRDPEIGESIAYRSFAP